MTRSSTVAFVPRNRLSPILSGAEGQSFADHVAHAEQAVEAIAPVLVESVQGDVRALVRLCRQGEGETFAQCREIGWLALGIVESAQLAGRPGLAEVAKGVWEMIDALSGRGVWHTDALRVHSDALSALLADETNGSVMTEALLRLRQAVGADAPPLASAQFERGAKN